MVFGGDRELPGIFRRVASQKAPAREIEYPESCSWAPKNLFSLLSKIRNVAEHFMVPGGDRRCRAEISKLCHFRETFCDVT